MLPVPTTPARMVDEGDTSWREDAGSEKIPSSRFQIPNKFQISDFKDWTIGGVAATPPSQEVPGSTLVPSVGFGVPPKRTFFDVDRRRGERASNSHAQGSSRRRDAFANVRDARATRSSQDARFELSRLLRQRRRRGCDFRFPVEKSAGAKILPSRAQPADERRGEPQRQIGRASCRERV